MNEFTKTLNLDFKTTLDSSSLKDVTKKLKEIESINIGFKFDKDDMKELENSLMSHKFAFSKLFGDSISEKTKESMSKEYRHYQELLLRVKLLKQSIKEVAMFGNDEETLKKMQASLSELNKEVDKIEEKGNITLDKANRAPKDNNDKFSNGVKSAYRDWAKEHTFESLGAKSFNKRTDTISAFKEKALETLKSFVTNALKELSNIASWNITSSTVYNKEASEMYMNYGLQGANAYAMNSALQSTGIDSIDTLYSDPTIRQNKELLNTFKEYYDLAKQQYEHDSEIAKEYQKFQKEFSLFKKELQKEVIDFFMENKDAIKSAIEVVVKGMEMIVNILSGIADFLGYSTKTRTNNERQASMNEILGISSSTNTTNNNKTNNVSVNNTYNGVGKTDETFLQNSGQLTYQQIIEYLGRA